MLISSFRINAGKQAIVYSSFFISTRYFILFPVIGFDFF